MPSANHSFSVCQIVAAPYHPGGLEKHFIEQCNAQARLGPLHAIAHESYRPFLDETVSFHPLDLARSRRNPAILWQLARRLRQLGGGIAHAHGKKAGSMLARIARFVPQKTVVTLHNLTARRHWMSRVDTIVCVSQTIAGDLGDLGDLPVEIIYNGITPPEACSTLELPGPRPILLGAGRLAPAKGFDVLIDAFAALGQGQLLIAGEGTERPRLENQIQRLGLHGRARLLGHRNHLQDLIHAADLVVISSRREGFSYVFAEALFAETPVVSTDVPIACELLPPERIAPIDDAQALCGVLRDALASRGRLKQDFAPLYRLARERFTIDAMITDTRNLYRRLLDV